MKVEILRGKAHIGGNIIKVIEDATAILLDCGALLPEIGQPKREDDFDINRTGHVDAIFLSHHHGDHSGLIDKLPQEAELYASIETINYMNTLDRYLGRSLRTAGRKVHGLFDGEAATVGSLSVTAYFVEHSAEGAAMFLVEGSGKRLLYTGDYKFAEGFGISGVDLLITEGTLLTRDSQAFSDEAAVEGALRKVMEDTKGRVFILQSSANLPRIRSVLAAHNSVSSPKRPLMQDVFLKYSLEQTGHEEMAAPYAFVWNGFDNWGDRAYDRIVLQYRDGNAATSRKRIADFHNAVVFIRPTMLDMLQKLIDGGMDISNDALVFSMWRGYEKEPQTAALVDLFRAHGVQPFYIHTSGHADREHLKALIASVSPRRLVCVHSEDAVAITQVSGSTEVVSDATLLL